MADADVHDAGVALARARWGNSKVSRAVAVVVERRDELDGPLKAQLREVTADPDGDDGR